MPEFPRVLNFVVAFVWRGANFDFWNKRNRIQVQSAHPQGVVAFNRSSMHSVQQARQKRFESFRRAKVYHSF